MDTAVLDVILKVGDLVFYFMDGGYEARVAVGAAQGTARFLGDGGELDAQLIGLKGTQSSSSMF